MTKRTQKSIIIFVYKCANSLLFNTNERKKEMSDNSYRSQDEFSENEAQDQESERYYDNDDDSGYSHRHDYNDIHDQDTDDDDDYDDYEHDEKPVADDDRRRRARDAGRQFRSQMARFEQDDYEDDKKEPLLSSWVKGIIGILVSLAFVFLVILLFAKVLFLHEPNTEQKTGSLTAVADTGTTFMTTTNENQQVVSKTTKEKIKFNVEITETDKDGNTVTNNTEQPTGKVRCISPVLVHPKPTSKSENLTTVPLNAEVDFIKNENGWYLITYNGITGYAWGQFFTTPPQATPQ